MNIVRFCLLAIATVAVLPASDFDGLVGEFARQTGAERIHIPFFGVARFAVAVAHPSGTSDLQMAVLENVHGDYADSGKITDRLVIRDGWKRIVRVQEKKGEMTNIYMLPEGKRLRMLVAVVNNGDATFVQLRIKPEALAKFVDEHDGGHHHHD